MYNVLAYTLCMTIHCICIIPSILYSHEFLPSVLCYSESNNYVKLITMAPVTEGFIINKKIINIDISSFY